MRELDAHEEQQLVIKAQQGTKTAFDALMQQYQHRLGKLVSRYVRDQAEVNDVTQEVFIKAYCALPKFRGESAFYTWLYRIAINTAKSYSLGMVRKTPYNDVDVTDHDAGGNKFLILQENSSPEGYLIRDEMEHAVFHIVERLPHDLRTAITLREIDGFSYEAIAEVMNCPVGTVRSRIFRAREVIEEQLKHYN